jgi:3-methyladenine DNA glycosylase Tag
MARLSRSRKLPNMDPQAKRQTCWGMADALMADYHDTEWGVPCRDDAELFERLMLEGFQAGLSWSTILNKRENFREAFEGWDAKRIAEYSEKDLERLMADPGIVRNRLKVAGAVRNARAFLDVQAEHGTLQTTSGRSSMGRRCRGRRRSRSRTCPRRRPSPMPCRERCKSAASRSSDRPSAMRSCRAWAW